MNRCDNCEWSGSDEQLGRTLSEMHHLAERLDPSSTVPSGECPECGCLAYPVREYRDLENPHAEVAGGVEIAAPGPSCEAISPLEALKSILGDKPDRWGFIAASNALDDEIRARARAAVDAAESRGAP